MRCFRWSRIPRPKIRIDVESERRTGVRPLPRTRQRLARRPMPRLSSLPALADCPRPAPHQRTMAIKRQKSADAFALQMCKTGKFERGAAEKLSRTWDALRRPGTEHPGERATCFYRGELLAGDHIPERASEKERADPQSTRDDHQIGRMVWQEASRELMARQEEAGGYHASCDDPERDHHQCLVKKPPEQHTGRRFSSKCYRPDQRFHFSSPIPDCSPATLVTGGIPPAH